MNKKSIFIIILAVALVGALYFFTMERKSEEKPSNENTLNKDNKQSSINEDTEYEELAEIEIGKEAPNFTLRNLEGRKVSLKDYRGKIVLLNFWATWCKFCDIEMPDLQKLDKENEDLVVLAVDVMEDKNKVVDYIKKGNYDFEVLLDDKGDVAKTYLVSAFPTTYFVGKDGNLIGSVPGMMTYPQMNQILDSIREEQ